jgi:hypothetical protein
MRNRLAAAALLAMLGTALQAQPAAAPVVTPTEAAAPAPAAPHPRLTLDQYVAALERLHSLVATNQLDAAHAEAKQLAGAEVSSPLGPFVADDLLLDDVGRVTRVDRGLLDRLERALAELRAAGAGRAAPPDPKLLRQVAQEQHVPGFVPGGEVLKTVQNASLLERIAGSIADMVKWIGEKLEKLLEWLIDLLPRTAPSEKNPTGGIRWMVVAVVVAIVLLIAGLAIEVIRRSRRGRAQAVQSSEPIGSARDDDPLSRGATEWERYAAQLAAAGRFREAIRAWYHAVLVTCYGAGILHFRKGRTNWEYVASLAPSIAWRPELIELTRRFEQEWYGADQSTSDANAECGERARRILESLHRGAA